MPSLGNCCIVCTSAARCPLSLSLSLDGLDVSYAAPGLNKLNYSLGVFSRWRSLSLADIPLMPKHSLGVFSRWHSLSLADIPLTPKHSLGVFSRGVCL